MYQQYQQPTEKGGSDRPTPIYPSYLPANGPHYAPQQSAPIHYSMQNQSAYGTLYTQQYPTPQPKQNLPPQEENIFWYAITSPFRPLTYLLILYFIVNFIFSTVSFVFVVTIGSIGIGLTPLCCFGLLILQILLHVIYFLAHCDARLYNCTASSQDQITVSFEVPREGLYHYSGYRISPDLTNFSKESLMAVFYFIFIKFPVAIATSVISLVFLAVSITLIVFPLYRDDYVERIGIFRHRNVDITVGNQYIEDAKVEYIVALGVILLYVSIGIMHLFANLQRWATKFFTCEFFATSGVIHLYSTLPAYAPVPSIYRHGQ